MSKKIPDDAFDYYVGLGPGRSHQAVADNYGTTKRAVTKVAVRDDWAGRLRKIELDAQEKSDAKLADASAAQREKLANLTEEARDRHLKSLRAVYMRAIAALGQYPMTSASEAVRAMEMVIKLERLIIGEPSERTEMSVEDVTKREMDRWIQLADDQNKEEAGDDT